jgi:plastocyanin
MIRRTLFTVAAAALVVIPTGMGAHVRAAAPAPEGLTLQGTVSHPKGHANLVVYVETVAGTFSVPAVHPVMDQKGMRFNPHVLTVVAGTTVDFLNSDTVMHNVFSPDQEGYNLGTWPTDSKRSYVFKHPGTYTQLCSVHPDMEAYIVVLQNPYFAVTNADGHFKIDNLPAGRYSLKVWGEHFKATETKKAFPVDVAADDSTTTLSFGPTTSVR